MRNGGETCVHLWMLGLGASSLVQLTPRSQAGALTTERVCPSSFFLGEEPRFPRGFEQIHPFCIRHSEVRANLVRAQVSKVRPGIKVGRDGALKLFSDL